MGFDEEIEMLKKWQKKNPVIERKLAEQKRIKEIMDKTKDEKVVFT